MIKKLIVTMIKPSKYDEDGFVQRFRIGYMPNVTLNHISSLTPKLIENSKGRVEVEVREIDEITEPDLSYLHWQEEDSVRHLVAIVGTQSHQFQRALDIAAFAVEQGALPIIGGPHVMTCSTEIFNGSVSFSKAEAELVWNDILQDAAFEGELKKMYGMDQRWQERLKVPILKPPSQKELSRHLVPMVGIYPARGCPFRCNFCSVIQIAGHAVRSWSVDTIIESIKRAKSAGAKMIIFTSDNFNKYKEAPELLDAMCQEKIQLPFFVQCDAQIADQEWFVEKLGRAGCGAIMVGAESFNRKILLKAGKVQNHPERYVNIVKHCKKYGIWPFFSNIIGFPDDDEGGVMDHIRELKKLGPTTSWFYILTPIPGTEQYDEFKAQGLITERNLDRFDATNLTWQHPVFSKKEMQDLLFRCHDEIYNFRSHIDKFKFHFNSSMSRNTFLYGYGYSMYVWYKSRQRVHPMLGGIRQFRRDKVSDYIEHRRKFFDCDLVPLPDSMRPSSEELARNIQLAKGGLLTGAPSTTNVQ